MKSDYNKQENKDSCSSSSTISTVAMENLIEKLKMEKHRSSTRKNYYAIWKKFNEFYIKLDKKPNSWEERIVLYVGYLIENKRRAQTIKSYISAIKSVLMDDGVILNENKYLLTSLTRACRFKNHRVRRCLLILKGTLNLILQDCVLYFDQQFYLTCLYRALFATAYYGLFRVGEITSGSHPVKAVDVHIANNKDKILFLLRSSKTHWTDEKPQMIKISKKDTGRTYNEMFCPFKIITQYVKVRGACINEEEPFFIFCDGTAVKPEHMRNVLRIILDRLNLNSKLYGTHGFRSGRSQDLLSMGFSLQVIRKLGRWASSAVFAYLK